MMHLILLMSAFLLLARVNAQIPTTAYIYVQDDNHPYDEFGLFSTQFVGLNLPSTGNSEITFHPGDWSDGTYCLGEPDESQTEVFTVNGPDYYITIGTAGHYWIYLTIADTEPWYNMDWMEIYILPSTNTQAISCYYCYPPEGWESGYPPIGDFDTKIATTNYRNPTATYPVPPSQRNQWLVPFLAVVITLAVVIPVSYFVYQRRKKTKEAQALANSQVELTGTTVEAATSV